MDLKQRTTRISDYKAPSFGSYAKITGYNLALTSEYEHSSGIQLIYQV